jgi:hypothetical protein
LGNQDQQAIPYTAIGSEGLSPFSGDRSRQSSASRSKEDFGDVDDGIQLLCQLLGLVFLTKLIADASYCAS